jgi:hypothetical protein
VTTSNVYNHKTKLYYFYEWHQFGTLQSSIHQEWAYWRCATLGGTTFSYSTSAALETWPMPLAGSSQIHHLSAVSERYHQNRQALCVKLDEGLTKTYNRFHDREQRGGDFKDIDTLRELHVEMDRAVATAYGWSDLDLGHGFHQTKQGLRFTISEAARREVLARLLKLNHERYAEEVRQGLHEKKKPSGKGRGKTKGGEQTASLFDQ